LLAYCNDPHAGPDTEYSLHHRNYNPKTGIFKSEDPAADDLNLYRYVANNPVNNEDPSGLDFVTNEGNIAVWVIESALGWNGERIDLGVLEDGVIHLRSKFGGGTISYSALQEFVKAGLSNQHLQFGVSSLRNLDEQTRSFYINFAISEVYYRVTHGSLRAGDRGDENGNVTHYAGAGGPVAAALIVEMMRQVAIELGMEFGGAKAVSVMLRGGKVIFKRGGQIVEVTSDTIAKKLGRKVDDCEIQNASKILDTAPKGLIEGFDFGKHLRGVIGDPPKGMVDPHAHHILFKKGLGPVQQALIDEGQAILRKVGIDPIYGKENLIWAPWRVSKQHGIESLQKVVDELRALERAGGDYDDFVDLLKKLGKIAAERS